MRYEIHFMDGEVRTVAGQTSVLDGVLIIEPVGKYWSAYGVENIPLTAIKRWVPIPASPVEDA